ncbi:MAG: hypothetical protein JW709_08850 [Sedimentisphaerales bacterium]|nr:hypothetical protein [Sedimentisphaerales bacterium]
MKIRLNTIVVAGAMMALSCWATLPCIAQASEDAMTAPAGAPDAEGVFPSLTHRGDIADFLKFVGVACHKNILPSPQVKGPVAVNLFDVTGMEALDAVLSSNGYAWEEKNGFIYVYTQKELAAIQAAAKTMQTRSFRLNYISAKDVEALISSVLSQKGQITMTPEAGAQKVQGAEDWAGANYIVVTDYPEVLDQVGTIISQTDVRPPQILVEATILVASVEDTNQLGVDLSFVGGILVNGSTNISNSVTSDASTDTGVNTSFTGSVGAGGLSIGVTTNNVGVLIRALESVTDVVTLGNPKVLTLNRQLGKVLVGNRDGYITTEVSQTTATQTVEFLETGTTLEFRPFVMEDGYIRMELHPEDSDGGVTVEGQFTLPSETTAAVETNVLVKDGHTIVIGGLFRERTSLGRSQVPILGNIPYLGNVFKSTNDVNEKEEVIFLITPHIVKEPVDYAMGEDVLDAANRLRLGSREGMLGTSRQRLAMWHYQQALRHQAAGKTNMALWDASLAAEIQPTCLELIDYRTELRGEQILVPDNGPMLNFMRRIIEMENNVQASADNLLPSTSPVATDIGSVSTTEVIVSVPAETTSPDTTQPVDIAGQSVTVTDGDAVSDTDTTDASAPAGDTPPATSDDAGSDDTTVIEVTPTDAADGDTVIEELIEVTEPDNGDYPEQD